MNEGNAQGHFPIFSHVILVYSSLISQICASINDPSWSRRAFDFFKSRYFEKVQEAAARLKR